MTFARLERSQISAEARELERLELVAAGFAEARSRMGAGPSRGRPARDGTRARCGAPTAGGEPCRKWPCRGDDKCHAHGGQVAEPGPWRPPIRVRDPLGRAADLWR